jgi:Leucine-rich repeat (LRR) protein
LLSGSIPSQFGDLSNLEALYLYNTELSGPIPESFSNLKSLKILVLNNNNLTGVVPGFLRNGDFERLNLEGNNFDARGDAEQELRELRDRLYFLNALTELYEEGLLTDEEFQEAKRQLLL